jgi:transcriptional regulator with XRE-family HTH domain
VRPEYTQLFDDAGKSVEYWAQTAILDFTEELTRLMDEANPPISRAELARRIGASPSYITKIFRGNDNFTLETMTKLARAVGAVVRVHLAPDGVVVTWSHPQIARDDSDVVEFDELHTWRTPYRLESDPDAANNKSVMVQ